MAIYAEHISFILSEIVRFGQMSRQEVLNLPFSENLATLPHPSGTGVMICGAAAHRRLWDIVDYALERSPHAGRIDPQAVFEKLQYIIVQRFLREKRELNRQEADRAVSAAIKVAAKARMNLTHLFPCHLGHSNTPESFSIGPVKFQQRSRAFERLEPALQAYLDRPSGESCRTGRSQDDRKRRLEALCCSA